MEGIDPSTVGLDLPFKGSICALELDMNSVDLCESISEICTGRVVLQYTHSFKSQTCNATIDNTRAHTGKKCLKVDGTANFTQKSLLLEIGQRYVLSAWVSLDDPTPRFDLNVDDVGIELFFSETDKPKLVPVGEVINGWQRIEGIFIPSEKQFDLKLYATQGMEVHNTVAYFDDIRIYPEDGSTQTYVYAPQNYRLTANYTIPSFRINLNT